MTSSCHSPSLIPSPDSLYPRSESYTRVKRGKRSWKNGKRSILTKVRSEVKFKDNTQRDALFRGIPLFGTVMREEWFTPWGYVAFRDIPVGIEGAVSLRSKGVRNLSTPLAPFFGGKLYRRMGWYIATPSSKISPFIQVHHTHT